MSFLKRAIFGFLGICIGIATIGAGIYAYGYLRGNRSAPPFSDFSVRRLIAEFPYKGYIILSGSMEPAIKTGSVVITESRDFYGKGDIVSFKVSGNEKNVVTHRIASVTYGTTYFGSATYTTKGDANNAEDTQPLKQEDIIGRVVIVIPYLGYASDFLKRPQGFLLFVIVPATILIYEELKSIYLQISGHLKRVWKKRDPSRLNEKHTVRAPRFMLVIPVFGALLLLAAAGKAYFSDRESSQGNVLSAAANFGTPIPESTPTGVINQSIADTLVINEVLPVSTCTKGNSGKSAQWLEVYNGYPHEVNLKNYKLSDGTDIIDLVNANNIVVGSGGFALLSHDTSIWGTGPKACFTDNGVQSGNLGGQLNLNTGTLQLLATDSAVIDTVRWGEAENLVPEPDQSIERNPTGFDTADGTGFVSGDFTVRATPRPGM